MVYTPANVVSYGFPIDATIFTYLLAAGMTAADVGKAVTLDTTAANRVRLAAAGEPIFGRLETYEDRDSLSIKTGAVSRQFKEKLPAPAGHGIAVGASVTGGAIPGNVAGAAAGTNRTIVVETGATYVVVEAL